MHYRLIVTLDAAPDSDSESVRLTAHRRLMDDDSFCGTGGRFGSPLSDWFVIGGRWSGCLAEALLGEPYRAQLHAELPGMAEQYVSDSYVRANAEALARIWAAHGGTGPHPFLRDPYEEYGAPDDAMPVTRTLYDAVLAPYQGESEQFGFGCVYADLDGDQLTPDAIRRKWAVVVDYHS